MTRLVLPWPPTTGNDLYEGTGRARHLKKCVREYWRVLNLRWIQAGRPTFIEPVSLSWTVTQPRDNDVDWDNIRKIVMDGLSAPRGRNKHVRALMFPRDSMRLIRHETVRWLGISKTNHGIAVDIERIALPNHLRNMRCMLIPITERPQPHGAGLQREAPPAPAAEDSSPKWRCPGCGDDADGCYCAEESEPITGGGER